MAEIDNFDLKILVELEKDSRQPISNIGKALRTSQQVMSYRLQNLERKAICGYYTVINFVKLGYTSYRTMIRLTNISPKIQEEIIDYFKLNKNIGYLAEIFGHWDIIIDYLAKSIVQYYCFLKDLKNKFPENIKDIDVLTTLENIYFGRDYFTNKYREIKTKSFICSEDLTIQKLDKTDIKILHIISQNTRIGSVEVSKIIKASPNKVIYRLRNLQERNIIEGYKVHINLQATGRQAYNSLIKFNNITDDKENQLIEYLQNNLCVYDITKVIGYWDFEINYEVKNNDDMAIFTRNIREKFNGIIKEFETNRIYKEHIINYFPGDLLDVDNHKVCLVSKNKSKRPLTNFKY